MMTSAPDDWLKTGNVRTVCQQYFIRYSTSSSCHCQHDCHYHVQDFYQCSNNHRIDIAIFIKYSLLYKEY